MTCINTGNAWGSSTKGGKDERDRDELSLHFWLLAVDLDGEQSSQELSFGLFSFARRLAVACLHRQPDLCPEKLWSDWWTE